MNLIGTGATVTEQDLSHPIVTSRLMNAGTIHASTQVIFYHQNWGGGEGGWLVHFARQFLIIHLFIFTGTCIDEINAYTCNCTNTGYEGSECETETDECSSSPCENGGTCSDMLTGFSCACTATGFDGLYCQDNIDDCPGVVV